MSSLHKILFSALLSYAALRALQKRTTHSISKFPKETYGHADAEHTIKLANGGAGPTGIFEALAKQYKQKFISDFELDWYQDISPNSLKQLTQGNVDIALVYDKNSAQQLIRNKLGSYLHHIFDDHFILVGPKKNPARLRSYLTPARAFFYIAKTGRQLGYPLFLSRDDGSGTNGKEKKFWDANNIKPQKESWYQTASLFPKDALFLADRRGLYTLTDRGTWLHFRKHIKNLTVYIQGGKELLNPCYGILQRHPRNIAKHFLKFLVSREARVFIRNHGFSR